MSLGTEDFSAWEHGPFAAKTDRLVWRGSANGGDMKRFNAAFYPRAKLQALAKKHPELIDFGCAGW